MPRARDTVGEAMTRDVVTVRPDDSVEAAVRAMVSNDIGAVVVAQEGNAIGVFTERDLLRRIVEEPGLLQRRVDAVMSSPVISTGSGTQMVDAFELMTSRGIRRLPVVDTGRLVGIVTERDLLRWVSTVASE